MKSFIQIDFQEESTQMVQTQLKESFLMSDPGQKNAQSDASQTRNTFLRHLMFLKNT